MALLQLQKELAKVTDSSSQISNAIDDVDKLIELLTAAREQVAAANDPHTRSMTITKLQNPIKQRLDAVNDDLKNVHKNHTKLGKSLDKAFSKKNNQPTELPTEHDPMAAQPGLINRAIAMHLLREGQFGVASTFIGEAQPYPPTESTPAPDRPAETSFSTLQSPTSPRSETPIDAGLDDARPHDLSGFHSEALQSSFASMYSILSALRAHNLLPAIDWARENYAELEARGSNLEFELCKLQFLWLFKGPSVNGLPDTPANGRSGALTYGRENFGRFQHRHLKEIQKLMAAMVFASNLASSPYRNMFDISAAFDEVAASFTREFCSLLGLSAESPLYVAATAGAIALPRLIKYTDAVKLKRTEWTTAQELAFETPLPRSMVYHSIFVCPVSKEQTTDVNPPQILPCGHVLARESLQKLAKGPRFKCPYCPNEGLVKDARDIIL